MNNPHTQTEKESECILQILKQGPVSTCDFKNVFFFVFTYQILKTELSQRRASSSSLLELLLVLMRRRRPDETPLEHRAVKKESDNIPDSASPNSIVFLTTAETFSKGIHIQ